MSLAELLLFVAFVVGVYFALGRVRRRLERWILRWMGRDSGRDGQGPVFIMRDKKK